jgi:hypothetical protein
MDSSNEVFIIDSLCSRDSDNVRDGNGVNCDIDNLTNRYSDGSDKPVRSEDSQPKTLAVANAGP